MLEAIMDGYQSAFEHNFDEAKDNPEPPDAVRLAMKQATKRTWKQLAKERLDDARSEDPLGREILASVEAMNSKPSSRSSRTAPSPVSPPWSSPVTMKPLSN